jgi:hypothetical protein
MTAYGNAANHPAQVPGLLIWLKADALVLNDADPVSTWTDSSGYGRDATGTTTTRPLYKAAPTGFNGKPAILFDGTDDILAFASLDLSLRKAVTVIVVCAKAGADSSQQVLYEFSTNYSLVSDSFILYRDTDGSAVASIKGNATTNTVNSIAHIGTSASIVTARFDTRQERDEATLAVDGHPGQYITTFGGNNTNVFGTQTSFLGCRSGGTLPFNGSIAEVLIYGRNLTARERKAVEDVLATKYAITRTVPIGVLAADGSSIGGGNAGNSAITRVFPDYLRNTLSGNWEVINHCHSGTAIYDQLWDAGDLDRWVTPTYSKNILVYGEGINDEFNTPHASVATIETRETTYLAARAAAGWTNVPCTLTPNSNAGWYGGGQVIYAADRLTLNTWKKATFANVADVGGDARIGDEGDQADTTYYAADQSHLVALGGAVMADVIARSMVTNGLAARFAPTDYTGCVGWWDASQITGLVDADPVSTWTNLATGIGNFTAASTLRPLYKTGIVNGATLPVVRFDGINDLMTTAAYDLSGTTAVSVFLVFGRVTAGTEYVVFERSVNYSSNPGGFLFDRQADNTVLVVQKGDVGQNASASSGTVTTAYIVSAAVIDRSLAGAAENKVTINANSVAQAGANNNTVGFGASDAFFLGGRSGGLFNVPGDIAELIVYNRALTIGERKRVELHLACKWGLF